MQKAREAAHSRRQTEWENIHANSVWQKSRRKGRERTQNLPDPEALLSQCNVGSGCGRKQHTFVDLGIDKPAFFIRKVAAPFLKRCASREIRNGSHTGQLRFLQAIVLRMRNAINSFLCSDKNLSATLKSVLPAQGSS